MTSVSQPIPTSSAVDSPYAWLRLAAALALTTIGGIGMWSIVVVLPAVQTEFGVARAGASVPYSLTMLGFVAGNILMGRLADRFSVIVPVIGGTVAMSLGYIAAAYADSLAVFGVVYGVMIGVGSSAMFGPLMADTSLWFTKRRGLAVALCASGNYFAGAVWPPIIEHFVATIGWRQTHFGIGVLAAAILIPLAFMLRRPSPRYSSAAATAAAAGARRAIGLSSRAIQALIMLAGLACCVAMSMPQVHIVAYCVDLGYGPARGAEMLSLMLGFGIVSRLASGWILDRIGGLPTLLLGSILQASALALYLPFDGLMSLYVISSVFGLVQGGIVPSYAVIVRELFPPEQAGFRVSLAISSTMAGMALGGWLSGVIFDATGSYQAALLNGIGWNLVNMLIGGWLLWRTRRPQPVVG